MECATDPRLTDPAPAGFADRCALVSRLSEGRSIPRHRRDPRDNPFDGVREGSLDYCRQARRLRALHGRTPVVLHAQLSQLKVLGPPPTEPRSTQTAAFVVIERLDQGCCDPDHDSFAELEGDASISGEEAVSESDVEVSFSAPIPWTCLNGAKVGKAGVSVLSRMREKLIAAPAMPPADVLTPSRSGSFADYVGERVIGPVLPYADRLALLREAGRRGIGRFEANLVIASVQHRLSNAPRREAGTSCQTSRIVSIAAFAVAQSLIVFGFWRLLHG